MCCLLCPPHQANVAIPFVYSSSQVRNQMLKPISSQGDKSPLRPPDRLATARSRNPPRGEWEGCLEGFAFKCAFSLYPGRKEASNLWLSILWYVHACVCMHVRVYFFCCLFFS